MGQVLTETSPPSPDGASVLLLLKRTFQPVTSAVRRAENFGVFSETWLHDQYADEIATPTMERQAALYTLQTLS